MRFLVFILMILHFQTVFACTKDIDCKGDRICIIDENTLLGECRSPTNLNGVKEQKAMKAEYNQEKSRNFHFNLLGVLQFGLTPTIEWGKQLSFLFRARLLNTGLLPYAMSASEGVEFAFGLGASFQVRKYFGKGIQNGPYVGGGIEMMYTKEERDTDLDEIYETILLIPQVEAGFRWHSANYFSGVGIFAGSANRIRTVGYTNDEPLVTGGFIWDIGWYF